MKTTLTTSILLVALLSGKALSAQTVYNITANTKFSSTQIPAKCTNCAIKIADGVTLTIDKDVELKNVSITGGSVSKSTIVVKDDKVKFLAPGSFTNINAHFDQSELTNTGALTINNSSFTFTRRSTINADSAVSLVSSSYTLLDDTKLEATAGEFSIRSGSVVIGDGSTASQAYAMFNGANLVLEDAVSFVTALGKKNYYFNINPYTANGQVISSLNNNLNCNGNGTFACSAPILRGPASISVAGVSSSAILPVTIKSFAAKSNGNVVVLDWITVDESNLYEFEIQRSVDGINYSRIGSVAARNSLADAHYSYTETAKRGYSYTYRLKMIDNDKSFTYSTVVKLSFDNSATTVKTYPNPATEYFAIDGSDAAQVQVISLNGQIAKVINGYVANTKISLNGVVSGKYVVKVNNVNGTSQAFKLIVSR